MSKHTPGPWVFEPCHTAEGARYYHVRAGPIGVADTYHCDPITVLGYGQFAGHIKARHSNPADAFLIAAAPDLLAACDLALARFDTEIRGGRPAQSWQEYVAQLRAAIAKAKP